MQVPRTTHEIEGVPLSVPAWLGSPPTARAEVVMRQHQDHSNWKLATRPFVTADAELAREVAACFDWYFGGHEMAEQGGEFVVTSKGYYHYVGA